LPERSNKHAGFTLLELLIVVAMLAILGGIVFASFSKLRSQMGLEQSVAKVSQDIQKCRSLAISRSRSCRLKFQSGNRYSVALSAGANWNNQYTVSLPANIRGSWQTGDAITFNSRGYASFPATPNPYVVTITKGNDTYVIVPTMVGAVRVVKR